MAPIQSPWLKVGSLFSGPTQVLLSSTYILLASDSCLRPLTHAICCARALADASAGNNIAARMAMIAMTTSSSINVKPLRAFVRGLLRQHEELLSIVRINNIGGQVEVAASVE